MVFEKLPGDSSSLSENEIEGIKLAIQSAFTKLKNLYEEITPIFVKYGFQPPSAGVIARDLSEKIETSIIQHCPSFSRGEGHADLQRLKKRWEVKICKNSGLTINQSAIIAGENYLVVNYEQQSRVRKIWILREARDDFFSPRRANSNARAVVISRATDNIQVLFDISAKPDVRIQEQKRFRKRKQTDNQNELFQKTAD